jgi:hypothetical protein
LSNSILQIHLDFNKNGIIDDWGLDGDFRTDGHGSGEDRNVDMPTYMKAYGNSGAGFNLFRWSVNNCAFNLFNRISKDGNRYSVQNGMWGDELVEALRQEGFRVWMTLFSWKPPYPNAADNPKEQEAVERYLKYVMARYGAYVDIWELLNEAEAPKEWINFASNYIRSIDPYKRLITTSWERPELDTIDINAPHWYLTESEFLSDLATSKKIADEKKWNKPVVFGEQGNGIQNWDETSALRMRLRSWTAFFEEGIFIFWNTAGFKGYKSGAANIYLGPEERAYISVLQDFTSNIDPDVMQLELNPSAQFGIRAYGLESDNMILGYFHHHADHDNSVSTSIEINLPSSGVITWIDPSTGNILDSYSVSSGKQTVTTPSFIIDLAFKIKI